MEYVLNIEIGNDTMQNGSDVADALGKAMRAVAGLELAPGQGGNIADRLGNTVGSWEVVE